MIYLVDDHSSTLSAWIAELEWRGYAVEAIGDASAAFEVLKAVEAEAVHAVILDVMLGVGDVADTRFSAERTDDYLETGLRLLEDLSVVNPAVFPARAVVMTNTLNPSTMDSARETCGWLGVRLLEKWQIDSAHDFGERIAELFGRPG